MTKKDYIEKLKEFDGVLHVLEEEKKELKEELSKTKGRQTRLANIIKSNIQEQNSINSFIKKYNSAQDMVFALRQFVYPCTVIMFLLPATISTVMAVSINSLFMIGTSIVFAAIPSIVYLTITKRTRKALKATNIHDYEERIEFLKGQNCSNDSKLCLASQKKITIENELKRNDNETYKAVSEIASLESKHQKEEKKKEKFNLLLEDKIIDVVMPDNHMVKTRSK